MRLKEKIQSVFGNDFEVAFEGTIEIFSLNLSQRKITVNPEKFSRLSGHEQMLILSHEKEHVLATATA